MDGKELQKPDRSGPGVEQLEQLWDKARNYGMSRRRFLFLLATSGAGAVLASCAPGAATTPTPTPVQSASPSVTPGTTAAASPVTTAETYIFFNPVEAATVKAVFGRLIPGNAGDPGAIEAGAHIYIDRALAGRYFNQQMT
jgi:gluconate 2-dehydrogenase gamma chain